MKRLPFATLLVCWSVMWAIALDSLHHDQSTMPVVILIWVIMFVVQTWAIYHRARDAGFTSKWAIIGFYCFCWPLLFIPTGWRTRRLLRRAVAAAIA